MKKKILIILVFLLALRGGIDYFFKIEPPYKWTGFYLVQLLVYPLSMNNITPFMGPITINVTDPITKKPIPGLEVEYFYEFGLPSPNSYILGPAKASGARYFFTDKNGNVTIPATVVDHHFYEATIIINRSWSTSSYNNRFGNFQVTIPLRHDARYDHGGEWEFSSPNSARLQLTTFPQKLNVQLVPNVANFNAGPELCKTIETRNIKQCCILRAEKGPYQNCGFVELDFSDDGETLIR